MILVSKTSSSIQMEPVVFTDADVQGGEIVLLDNGKPNGLRLSLKFTDDDLRGPSSRGPFSLFYLTKRAEFAALAMQGLLASGKLDVGSEFSDGEQDECAAIALSYADALIRAMEEHP